MCDQDYETCSLCQGTGIGQYGDPNTSKCYMCKGRGYFLPEPEDDSDRAYDKARDRRIMGD